jgi:hypothetical protein
VREIWWIFGTKILDFPSPKKPPKIPAKNKIQNFSSKKTVKNPRKINKKIRSRNPKKKNI